VRSSFYDDFAPAIERTADSRSIATCRKLRRPASGVAVDMGVANLGGCRIHAVLYYHITQHIDLYSFSNLSAGFN
jgi:hypothetical protein